LNGAALNCV
jgi:hypothetical protein